MLKQLWNKVHRSRAHASVFQSCTPSLFAMAIVACSTRPSWPIPLPFSLACWHLHFVQRFRPLFFVPLPPHLYYYFFVRLFTLLFVSSLPLRRPFSSYDLSSSRPFPSLLFSFSRTTFSSSNTSSKLQPTTWSALPPRTRRTPKPELKNEPPLPEAAQQVSLPAVLAIPHLPARRPENQHRQHHPPVLSLHHRAPLRLLRQESPGRRHLRALPTPLQRVQELCQRV